jgi:hypothetical protein
MGGLGVPGTSRDGDGELLLWKVGLQVGVMTVLEVICSAVGRFAHCSIFLEQLINN